MSDPLAEHKEGVILLREAIATGATVEEAKEAACKELGVESFDDHVEFEILEMSSKKGHYQKDRRSVH